MACLLDDPSRAIDVFKGSHAFKVI